MANYRRYYIKDYKYVFITIVTYKRRPILINNLDLLRQAFVFVLKKYKFKIFAISVLQDHIHMIIKVDNIQDYSNIISNFKKYFSYNYNNKPPKTTLPNSMQKRKEAGIWQRRFYEHIIRDEKDLQNHTNYIHYNPYKHYKISPRDWEFSTFSKFVKNGFYDINWCDYEGEISCE